MLIGLGHLGGVLLELLAREGGIGRITACSRDRERGVARCNLARLGALAQGIEARIEHRALDLYDADSVSRAVRDEAPDLILSTASMQTWWLSELLPGEAATPLARAGFGLWLPFHLAPTLALMRALRDCGYGGITLTAAYPDVVNRILGRLDLAPTCGVGNIGEVAAKVQLMAARKLDARPDAIRVTLVSHHALECCVYGTRSDTVPPHYLSIEHEGRDISEDIGAEELLLDAYPLPPGPLPAFLTAGATIRLVHSMLASRERRLHAPAPGGLPGGYPVLAGSGRVRLEAIPGLSRDEAIAINERSQPYDGIERIEEDGTAVLTSTSRDAARAALGYDGAPLKPDEARGRGEELLARFREYADRHGGGSCEV